MSNATVYGLPVTNVSLAHANKTRIRLKILTGLLFSLEFSVFNHCWHHWNLVVGPIRPSSFTTSLFKSRRRTAPDASLERRFFFRNRRKFVLRLVLLLCYYINHRPAKCKLWIFSISDWLKTDWKQENQDFSLFLLPHFHDWHKKKIQKLSSVSQGKKY